MSAEAATSIFVTAQDGLKLHVRAWGSRAAAALPVVCLPGLARTGADFEVLAAALAGDPRVPRRVLALDSRGRGKSDYDRNPANYSLPVELADLLAVLTALAVSRAVLVGTSRGGILIMLLAAARPTVIAGCVLNDIGPVIEPKGLLRIKKLEEQREPPIEKLRPSQQLVVPKLDQLRNGLALRRPVGDDGFISFQSRQFPGFTDGFARQRFAQAHLHRPPAPHARLENRLEFQRIRIHEKVLTPKGSSKVAGG